MRKSFVDAFRAALAPQLLTSFVGLVVYVTGTVWLLASLGFWRSALLKDTLLWFVLAGAVVVFEAASAPDETPTWKRVLRDTVGIVVVVEFLAATYTFSLLTELILTPVMAIVAMVNGLAKTKPEHRPVEKLTAAILACFGLTVLVWVGYGLVTDFGDVGNSDSVRQLALPLVLSIALIPFAVALSLYVALGDVFWRLRFRDRLSPALLRYAKRRIIGHVGLSPVRVRRFVRANALRLIELNSKHELDSLLAEDALREATEVSERHST